MLRGFYLFEGFFVGFLYFDDDGDSRRFLDRVRARGLLFVRVGFKGGAFFLSYGTVHRFCLLLVW